LSEVRGTSFWGPLPAAFDFRYADCCLVTLRSLHQIRDATEQLCSRLTFTAHGNLTNRNDLGAQVGLSSHQLKALDEPVDKHSYAVADVAIGWID
jgi:hypothetical protein